MRNQVGQVPVGAPERALIDQLQPYHKGVGFRAYALGIPRDLNNHDKHRGADFTCGRREPEGARFPR
jgi:hypothetical protein